MAEQIGNAHALEDVNENIVVEATLAENNRASRSPIRAPLAENNRASRSSIEARRSRSLSASPTRNSRRESVRALSNSQIGIDYEIIAGQRKNSKLLYTTNEKYLYIKHNKTKHSIQYDCYDKGCGAKVFIGTENGLCFKKSTNNTHNHGDASQIVHDMKMVNNVKQSVSNASTLAANIGTTGSGSVRTIYQKCLAR